MGVIATALAALVSLSAAQVRAVDNASPTWLDVSGNINFDGTSSKNENWNRDIKVHDAEIRFEVLAREGMKLVIKAELENILNKYIKDDNLNTDIGNVLEEAYIQIEADKTLGLPRAIITFGKQRMAFGQQVSSLPMFKDTLLYKLNNEEELVGLTVTLPATFMKVVDTVALSLYETGSGDMAISKDKGLSVKLSKRLRKQVEVQISGLLKQHETADNETRASLGFVYTSQDGTMKVWAEGLLQSHNPEGLETRYGSTFGAAKKIGVGAIVIEASILEGVGRELALAYNLPVGSYLVLSPEVRYIKKFSGENDTIMGIRARLEFEKSHTPVARPH